MLIKGTVALVTGGASGIGKMMVDTLLKNGAKFVSILDVNKAAGSSVLTELQNKYSDEKVNFIECDVSSKEQLEDCFNKAHSVHGRLDIVCNNAGISEDGDVEKLLQINLLAPIIGTNLAKNYMMDQADPSGGVIVNTASLAGLIPIYGFPYYSASKAGVVSHTRAMASDPRIQKANIRLNALCPAFVDTDILIPVRRIDARFASMMNLVPMSYVTEGFLMAVEDDSLNGQAIRISSNRGVDLESFESAEEAGVKFNVFKTK